MPEDSGVPHSREFAAEALQGSRIASVVDPSSTISQWLDASGAERIDLWAERDRLTEDAAHEATLHAHAIVIDLDQGATRGFWLAAMVSPPCGVLFTAESIDAATCRKICHVHWGYRSKRASQGDFLLALRRLVRLCIPDLAKLAAHGVQLWRLSPQQARVLHYNLWSYCDQDIADALSVSVHTVQEYQEDLRKKTGARNKQSYLARLLEVSGACQPPIGASAASARRVTAARVDWNRNVEFVPMRLEGRGVHE